MGNLNLQTIYLVYETLHGELLYEAEGTQILGVYDTIEKAILRMEQNIEDNKEMGFVLDENYASGDMETTMFYQEQDNFNSYFDLSIKEMEVK